MARVELKFDDGTTASLEGTPEEVAKLVKLLRSGHASSETVPSRQTKSTTKKVGRKTTSKSDSDDTVSLVDIVNTAKSCDEAEAIETQVLDRSSQVDRVLLPLFILHEHFKTHSGLTSGEISKITKELGIPIQQPNVAKTISGTASKYVMGDGVRKKGTPILYKLSRKGAAYFKSVLSGTDR